MTESSTAAPTRASLNEGIAPATAADRLRAINAEGQAAVVRMGSMLSIHEAAKLLRRETWDLYSAVTDGHLLAFQPGGEGSRILIRLTDLERYVLTAQA